MSQEDPTIVVTPVESKKFMGGAGIVAAHAAGLGAMVKFISVVGEDSNAEYALKKLKQYSVDSTLHVESNRPTTLKQRFRSNGKSLLRVSHLHQEDISLLTQEKIMKEISEIITDMDLVVFSDFNYGCLPQSLVDKISETAETYGVRIVADSQSSSQVGDISRFKNMDLITPTEREARIATKNKSDGLPILTDNLKKISKSKNILLKLGHEGLFIHSTYISSKEVFTDQIPALNSNPVDISGAGDSLLISSSLALISNASIWEAGLIGSISASIQVSRLGNRPLNLNELIRYIRD